MTRRPRGTRRAVGWSSSRPGRPSAHRQDDQRLVVEAGDAASARDLAVGVEPGDRGLPALLGDPADLVLDALVAEHSPAGDAVEGEQAEGRAPVERGERVLAGPVGGLENRSRVALHRPDEAALRDLRDADQRLVLEVRAADEPDVLLLAPAPQAER